jgi:hypothetical protein
MTQYTIAYYFKKLIKDMPDELNTMKEFNAYIKKALNEAQKAAEWDKTLERYFEIYFRDYKITNEKEQNDLRQRHTMNESLLSEEGIIKYRRDIKKAVAKSEKNWQHLQYQKSAKINRDAAENNQKQTKTNKVNEDVGAKIRSEAKQKYPNDPSAQLKYVIEKDGARLRDTFGIHFG